MEILVPPVSVYVQHFEFKYQNKTCIFESHNDLPNGPCNMIAVSSNHGLIFVGSPLKELLVFQTKDIVEHKDEECRSRSIALPNVPHFLTLNVNQDTLAVIFQRNSCLVVVFYDVKTFSLEAPAVHQEIIISSNPDITVSSVQWNPCIADMIAVCTSDGNLSVYQLKQSSIVVQTHQAIARCLCWSPKGKQLVTGNFDGTLSQYKPDLTLVKNIPAPKIFSNPCQCIAIHWISNFQFCVVYSDPSDLDSRPCVTIVNTPKAGPITCINYEDICYSMGNKRPVYYYLQSLPIWGIILASSSNSVEVGVLGSKTNAEWYQWNMNDDGRAELPMMKKKQESYPIGLAFDTAAIHQLTYGENEVMTYMPMLHLLSHTGLLVTFNVINSDASAPNICSLPNFITIPDSLLKLQSESLKIAAVDDDPTPLNVITSPPSVGHVQAQNSFTIQQSSISSTPVLPKPNSPFGLGGLSKPSIATNLFGPKLTQMQLPVQENTSEQEAAISPVIIQMQPSSNLQMTLNQSQQPATPPQISNPVSTQPMTQPPEQDFSQKYSEMQESAITKQEKIKKMLVKEANDFQSDVYKLLMESCKVDTKIGDDSDIVEINQTLKKLNLEISSFTNLNSQKSHVDDLKRDILQVLSIIAEAKAQPNTHELHQIAHLDPVSAKQQVSIKRLLYYVDGQVRLANQALDRQWETFQADCKNKLKITGSDHMIKPSLETVYQPLVRQQEILSRQRSVLAFLKQTIESANLAAVNKPHGTLLKTKYLQKSDEKLSKLAKNLLNMTLEPTDLLMLKYQAICENYSKLTPSKLNALREKFSNHTTVRIKPMKVEMLSRSDMDLKSNLKSDAISSNDVDDTAVRNETAMSDQSQFKSIDIALNDSIQDNNGDTLTEPLEDIKNNVTANSFMGKTICSPIGMSKSVFTPPQPIKENITSDERKKNQQHDQQTSFNRIFSSNTTTTAGQAFSFSPPVNTVQFSKSAHIAPAEPAQVDLSKSNLNSSLKTINATYQHSAQLKPLVLDNNSSFAVLSPPETDKQSKPAISFPIVNPIATTANVKIVNQDTTISSKSLLAPVPTSYSAQTASSNVKLGAQFSTNPSSAFFTPVPKNQSSLSKMEPVISPTIPEALKSLPELGDTKAIFTCGPSNSNLITVHSQSVSTLSISAPSPMSSLPLIVPSLSYIGSSVIQPTAITSTVTGDSKIIHKSDDTDVTPSVVKSDLKISPANIFSNALTITTTTAATSAADGSIFGSTKADSSIASIFSSKVPQSSLFGTSSNQNSSGIFGKVKNEDPSSPSSVFGTPLLGSSPKLGTNSITAAQFFATSPNGVPAFETSSTTTIATTAASTVSLITSTIANPSIFGGSSTVTTTAMSIFGNATKTTDTTGSIFRSPSTGTTSAFGVANTTTTASPSVFETNTSSAASVFGKPSNPPPTSAAVFVSSPAANTTPKSVFGTPPSTSNTTTSLFGSPTLTVTSTASGFGNNANTIANLFESTSISVASDTNAFGSSGGSLFSGKSTFGKPLFGQSPTSIFGGTNSASSFGEKNAFGSNETNTGFGLFTTPSTQSNIFGSPSGSAFSTAGSIFSSAQPSQSQIFGSTQTGGATFGSTSVFGSKPAFGQSPTFGSNVSPGGFGAFSAGNEHQSVAQTGFGSPSAFQKPQGNFGSPSVFGSSPQMSSAFGAAPSFGSAPVFGSGSPVKPFGSPAQPSAGGFGSPTQQSSTFENLATQNTLTFGNLAQQTPQAPSQPPFQTSPSFSGWRG